MPEKCLSLLQSCCTLICHLEKSCWPEWSLDGILELKIPWLSVVGDCHHVHLRGVVLSHVETIWVISQDIYLVTFQHILPNNKEYPYVEVWDIVFVVINYLQYDQHHNIPNAHISVVELGPSNLVSVRWKPNGSSIGQHLNSFPQICPKVIFPPLLRKPSLPHRWKRRLAFLSESPSRREILESPCGKESLVVCQWKPL